MAGSGSRSKGTKATRMEYHDGDPLKRKQTILSLIDMLLERNNDADTVAPTMPDLDEEDLGYPAGFVRGALPDSGAEQFFKFEVRIENFDKELRGFANAARQLGSSVGILSSAFKLRERLAKILFLFRENAANLYPRKIARQPREAFLASTLAARRRQSSHDQTPDVEPESLPAQFESFAKDVGTFLNCLNEFPEFTDEAVNQSMREFEGDLKYWASCLAEYKDQFRSPAVQRYVHELSTEIGDHVDDITGTLSMFIEIGIPTIRFHQQHSASNQLNQSTMAIFFSVVTVIAVQSSHGSTGTTLADAVNALWFSSLVLSITAAINSLIGLTWKQAMYRSPGHRVPWWVLIWIKRSPFVLLVASVVCFLAGLVLFIYSSGQGLMTKTIVTTLTVVASFGIASVSVWFATERWIFIQHRGQKWLEEVIAITGNQVMHTRVMRAGLICLRWCSIRIAIVQGYFARLSNWMFHTRQPHQTLPIAEPSQPPTRVRATPRPPVHSQNRTTTVVSEPTARNKSRPITIENRTSSAGQVVEGATVRNSDTGQLIAAVDRSSMVPQPIAKRPEPSSLGRGS